MSLPTCPTNCAGSLPEVDFSYCAPVLNPGGITRFYLTNDGYPLTDWTSLAEWNTRLSNDSTDADAIRTLVVLGDKPAPEKTEIEISDDRKVYIRKKHTINFRIDEVSDDNYAMVRQLECGGQFLGWYKGGDYLYGGNDGIKMSITLDDIHPESNQELNTLTGMATWEAKFHPERINDPLD